MQIAIKLREQGTICILERSLFGNNVFTKLHRKLGNLSGEEYRTLQLMITLFPYIEQADHLLYIDTTVDTCIKRQKLRGRKGEQIYDREYNQQLKDTYNQQLETCPIPHTRVDWNCELVEALESLDHLMIYLKSMMDTF